MTKNCDFEKQPDTMTCRNCGFTTRRREGAILRNCTSEPAPELPSLVSQVGHLVSDMAKWVSEGLPVVNRNEKERRLSICKACPLYTGTRCSECGCQCGWAAWLETKDCPKGKW